MKIDLSLVIPFYNEEACAGTLLKEIEDVMSSLDRTYEILAIDDGSTDETPKILQDIATKNPNMKVITLARNYGQTSALSAGFDNAQGEWILSMDGDGQNGPKEIPKFVERISEDTDLISGWRRHRSEKDPRRILTSRFANKLIKKVSGIPLHDFGCTMKLYRREFFKEVHLYGEMHRFIPIFIHLEGGRISEIEINHLPRLGGTSKYGLERIFKVIMDLVVILFLIFVKDKPIYLFGGIGLGECFIGMFFVMTSLLLKFLGIRDIVETPLPNMGMFLLVLGILTVLIGLLTDLTMRTYYESQGKKPYRIRPHN